jgi:Phage tail sheath protein subtilisin-like domain
MAALVRRASDVRITEIDLSTTISTNSNATAAFAGVSSRGRPIPTFYSNFEDFRFDWGDPDASVSFDGYSAFQYFKEGNSLWANRAIGVGALYSAASVKVNSSGNTVITTLAGIIDPDVPEWNSYVTPGEDPLFLITSKRGPGSYGNRLAVSIESTSIDPVGGVTATVSASGGSIGAGTFQYRVAAVGRNGEALASSVVSVTVASGTTNAVNVGWTLVPGALGYYIYGRSGSINRIGVVGATTSSFLDNGVSTVDPAGPITNSTLLPVQSGIFTLNVFDLDVSSQSPVESFLCSLKDQTDETGAQMEITQRVNPFSRYIRVESYVYSLITNPVIKSVTTPVSLGGGASGAAPTSADLANALEPFANKELYVIDVLLNNGRSNPVVQRQLDAMAVRRADTVAFLDTPSSAQKTQQAVDYRNLTLNLNSSYSALFSTDLLVSDTVNGKLLYVPPSGSMAALYARTSRVAQPWFSIAGLNRGLLDVLGVRETYDDGQATQLFRNQLNYTRKFVGRGIPLWEQMTLYTKNSALQFLNVRFLCNLLKRSVYDFLIFGLQEPGDDILRKQLQFGLEEYLKAVQAARGISSFRVVIDDTNNPPSLTNSGVLAVAIIIVPILSVREIQLSLIISKEGLEVTEQEISSV